MSPSCGRQLKADATREARALARRGRSGDRWSPSTGLRRRGGRRSPRRSRSRRRRAARPDGRGERRRARPRDRRPCCSGWRRCRARATLASASGLTSGTTSGTVSSRRKRLLRSTTAAPACAATGAHSPATRRSGGEEARGRSPSNAPGREQARRAPAGRLPRSCAPAVRGEPSRRSSPGRLVALAEQAAGSPAPTRPDAPTTATRSRSRDHRQTSRRSRTSRPIARQPTRLVAGRGEVGGAMAGGEHVGDRALDRVRRLRERRASSDRASPPRGSRPAGSPCPRPRCRAPSRGSARRDPGSARPGTGAPASDADGSMPMEPASIDASSVRMSPKRFSVAITSKSRGPADEVHRHRVDQHVLVGRRRGSRARPRARPRARAATTTGRSPCRPR